jgi:hypothetical protein
MEPLLNKPITGEDQGGNPTDQDLLKENPELGNAPPKCEYCDADLPTVQARAAHVAETHHSMCFWRLCTKYVPIGTFYGHMTADHAKLPDGGHWDDHHVAAVDRGTIREVLPWAREAYYRQRDEECRKAYKDSPGKYDGGYLTMWQECEAQLEKEKRLKNM